MLADGPGSQLEIRGGYDPLNRLTNTDITIDGVTTAQNLTYAPGGNIKSKTGVGDYHYGGNANCAAGNGAGPHAVCKAGANTYAYDANGNLTGGAGRAIAWTAWNMPESITSAGQTQSWLYGPEHERYKMTAPGRTTWYMNPGVHQGGHYERTLYAGGAVEHRHTLYAGGRPIGEYIKYIGAASQTRYFHGDAQGSITAVTDQNGAVITRYRYDPWGKQTVAFGSNAGIDQTRQGHTGHEMLDNGLTHMNGRLYDPALSRFISADPYVDNPFDLQSLNRYSYVNNNPLGYTDPSGYFKLFGKKWSWWRDRVVKPVVAAWVGYYVFPFVQWGVGAGLGGGVGGYAAGTIAAAAASGAVTSLIATGSLDGWQYNALSAGLFYGAGDLGMHWNLAENSLGRAGLHAAAGCISASASGGSCGRGALSAGFSQYAGSNLPNAYDSFITRVVLGGTASVLGGGKFENGASTAAFGYLYNCGMHPGCWSSVASFVQRGWSALQSLWVRYGPQATALAADLGGVNGTLSTGPVVSLGHHPEYVEIARQYGYKFLNSGKAYDAMGGIENNLRFLDYMYEKGATFMLSPLRRVESTFAIELEHMKKAHGLIPDNDFNRLIPDPRGQVPR